MVNNSERLLELIHGLVAANIVFALKAYVKPRKLGRVGMEIRHGLPQDRYNDRLPDVSFSSHTERPVVKKGSVPEMPDLAVEVKFPDDKVEEMRAKAAYYLKNGSRLVWLINPHLKTVEVWQLAADGTFKSETLTETDNLSGEQVLPGFSLPITEVFEID